MTTQARDRMRMRAKTRRPLCPARWRGRIGRALIWWGTRSGAPIPPAADDPPTNCGGARRERMGCAAAGPANLRQHHWIQCLVGGLVLVTVAEQAFALQRAVRARIANYEQAAVSLRNASIQLTQTYSTPSQFPLSEMRGDKEDQEVQINRSRVRYANRLNQQVPTYLLEGELEVRNNAPKAVVAMQITAIFLNAFRERIETDRQTLAGSLRPSQVATVRWARNLPHQEVFELYFVVTAARFEDGSVWSPTEEMILLP